MTEPRRPNIVSAHSRPRWVWLGWRWWEWLLLATAVGASLAVELAALFLIEFAYSSTCYEQPSASAMAAGERALFELLVGVLVVWGAIVALVSHRWRVVLAGVLCVFPVALASLYGLDADAWVGGFCF